MVKYKTKKTEQPTKKGTLDQRHTEKITRFEKLHKTLPAKRKKLASLEAELARLKAINPKKYELADIRRKAELMDLISNIKSEISSVENCTESLDYISKTLPILINYYDNDEIIDDGIGEEFVNDIMVDGKKNILSYFLLESNASNEAENKKVASASKKKSTTKKKYASSSSGSKSKRVGKKVSRAVLYESYLNATDINHRKPSLQTPICVHPNCGGERIVCQDDSSLVCRKCGRAEAILITYEKPNYNEPVQDSGAYAYKRINHLTEIMSQLQAKESTDIRPKIFEAIYRELKKRKIDKNDLDIFKLRRILKKLGFRKYYDHVPHILQIINGKEPPNFSRAMENKIKKMFKDIQKPFEIYCPKSRKNFLNYSYVLHKFCELLGLDEFVGYFPLLKNNGKLRQHDRIWENICKYMRWEYIKSI